MDRPAPAIDANSLPKLPHLSRAPQSKLLEIVLPIASGVFVFAAMTAVVILQRRQLLYAELREDWEVEFGPHWLSYKDVDKHFLGIGGFGRVYKGVLRKSMSPVAVKKVSHESRQGMREFIAEVVSMGRLRHKNVMQLLGYCRRKGELLLVYDHMPNGSLDKYLHYNNSPPNNRAVVSLDWAQRFRIIKGVASGLLYLHEDWSSNVLLDSDMNGRLGDFGLAQLYDHDTDPHTTHVVGTMGYIASELTRMGRASTLTDVFAFGVFLLEVTCGRRPIEQVESHWCDGSLANMVDRRLVGNYDVDEAFLSLKLGLLCSHQLPCARPSMRQVMQYLDGNALFPEGTFGQIIANRSGSEPNVASSPSLSTSFGTISVDLSGGRSCMRA
ncbi:hypothetical protein BRADI_1g57806v3 [Brachypodium distachyon]|uniref:Protein kinase domain-containing protein n=1 Tax=Brachypodium distachyon TaxID=15368 RepID=A0A0Q3HDK1_BRADI|nr:hypothetical protein BRADI_1g57806v3 [Brachypodium distachyon]